MSDVIPPRTYREWEALIAAQSSCSEELALALRSGTTEPGGGVRVFALVRSFVERTISAEKDRYLDSLDELGSDLDGFELVTRRFVMGCACCLAPLKSEGLPEDAAAALGDEAKRYVECILAAVQKAMSDESSGNWEYVIRRARRLWQQQ